MMAAQTLQLVTDLQETDVEYPASDGQPMAETDTHRDLMVYLIEALKAYFQANPQVYVAGNLFIYYEKGDPQSRVAPDVFVVSGVSKRRRRVYRLWEEGKGPDVVIEVSSRSTRGEDLWEKRGLYEFLGVEEYFLFDPLDEYLTPPLQGYRLVEGWYRALEPEQDGSGGWRLLSRRLGLELRTEGNWLRLYDPARGELLLTPLEAQERMRQEAEGRRQAEVIARQEIEGRRQAEARLAELEAELARLRGERGSP
jgi:Uma2 family endonuclease